MAATARPVPPPRSSSAGAPGACVRGARARAPAARSARARRLRPDPLPPPRRTPRAGRSGTRSSQHTRLCHGVRAARARTTASCAASPAPAPHLWLAGCERASELHRHLSEGRRRAVPWQPRGGRRGRGKSLCRDAPAAQRATCVRACVRACVPSRPRGAPATRARASGVTAPLPRSLFPSLAPLPTATGLATLML